MAELPYGMQEDLVNDMLVLDYDTIKYNGVRKRIEGLNAPEIQQFGGDAPKPGEPFGDLAASQIAELIKSGGFEVLEKGYKDNHDRDMIRLVSPDGSDFTDKTYLNGVLRPDEFTDDRARELFDIGQTNRAMDKALGKTEDLTDPWVVARLQREQASIRNTEERLRAGAPIGKKKAYNEAEWAALNARYGEYSPLGRDEVWYHTPGANFDNTAYSVYGTGWDRALGTISSGLDGMASTYYDLIGDKGSWLVSEERARATIRENANLPTFIDNVGDIRSFRDFGEYTAGLLGQAFPYLLGIAGSAATAALLTPASLAASLGISVSTLASVIGASPFALIYAGQTYNDMEGTMEQKDASIALAAGAAMAALDLLGLRGLLKGSDVLTRSGKEDIAKAYMKANSRKYHTTNPNPPKNITMAEARDHVNLAFKEGTGDLVTSVKGLVKFQLAKATVAKQVGKDAQHGMIREGLTEVAQETVGYMGSVLGSEKEFDSSEYGDVALNSLIGGALAGGIISPVLGTPGEAQAYRRLKRKFNLADVQPDFAKAARQNTQVINKILDQLEMDDNDPKVLDVATISGEELKLTKKEIRERGSSSITKDAARHREANKMSNKGVVQWAKDIGKNFVSRPLKWFHNSPMAKYFEKNKNDRAIKRASDLAESVVSLFSPTNEDTVSGQAIYEIETGLYFLVQEGAIDLLSKTMEHLGTNASLKGRIKATKEVEKWVRAAKKGKEADLSPEAQEIIKYLKEVTELWKEEYTARTGQQVNFTFSDLFLNKTPDKKSIEKNQDAVKAIMMKRNHFTQARADAAIAAILAAPEGSSWDQVQRRMSINDVTPSNPDNRFRENPFSFEGMEEYTTQDGFADLENSGRELMHNALVQRYIGPGGSNLKSMLSVIKDAAGESWDDKFAHDIISAAEIWMGVYNPIKSDRLRALQANVSFVNLVTLLGTGGPAQLPELIAALLGRISAGQRIEGKSGTDVIKQLQGGAKTLFEHYKESGKQMQAKYWAGTGLTPASMWSNSRRRFVKAGRSGITYGSIGQQGFNAEEIHASKLRAQVANTFVTVSLIKPITDISRIVSDGIGNDAIFHYLDILDTFHVDGTPMTQEVKEAYDMIAETRVPPLRLLALYTKMKNELTEEFSIENVEEMHKTMSADQVNDAIKNRAENHGEFGAMLDVARQQWVDNALANPNPGSRSRISNDPHVTLLFQFRGYILTFAASILPRLIKRATSGNPNQDVQAITILAGMVAMGFLGQILKDEWKTEGRPYWLQDAEYVQRGFQASGLMGPFDFVLDAINPIYGERSLVSTAKGFLGPTYGNLKQIGGVLEHSLSGDWDKAQYAALKGVPIIGHKNRFRKEPIATITEPLRSILGD